jgi:hypothetical protein
MGKSLATHTTHSNKWLYRLTHTPTFSVLHTGVEFWDAHTNQWRASIVSKRDLIEL